MPRGVEFGEYGLGGDFLVHDQPGRPVPGEGLPVLGEHEHFACLGGFGQVGVGVDQGLAGAVLGEERQHRAGALGAAGHVVLFQGDVVAPVHDGVEVQVQVAAGVGDQVGGQHRLAQGGE